MTYPRWKSGLCLAVLTSMMWGSLPLALKVALTEMDPLTVAFYRFLLAFIFSWLCLAVAGQTGRFRAGVKTLPTRHKLFLGLAALGLTSNYVTFVWGVEYASPANSQIFVQLAPLLFGASAVVLFKEKMGRLRWGGVGLLLAGLVVFYQDQSEQLASTRPHYGLGCLLLMVAALCWVVYAIFQKRLNSELSPFSIMTAIYFMASLALLPLARPSAILDLSSIGLLALLYCGLNTLIAYGAFAEAINRWEASRVSSVLPLTPVFTILMMPLGASWLPQYLSPEKISSLGGLGVCLVVCGSLLAALGRVAQSGPSRPRPESAAV